MVVLAAAVLLFFPGILAAPSPQLTGEIRSYHQVGDKIKGEYSRLHPDGSVTKTWAFGDTKNGLQYKTYQMDPLGNVKNVATPQTQQMFQQPQQPQQQQQQLNQAQPQQQIQDQGQAVPGTQAQNIPGAAPQANIPPGVNWFLQQPLMNPVASGVDPFAADPFSAPAGIQNPAITDPLLNPFISNPFAPAPATNPLLGTNNPFWNFWNF